MLQHVLLGDIAPVLLLLSLSRVILRPVTRRLMGFERALGPFASPVTGLVLWLSLMYLWHVPALYEAAIENPFVHLLEHASFFTAGVAVWWPLIQPVPMRRRLTGLWTVAYIGARQVRPGRAGALPHLVRRRVLYDFYEGAPRIWGLDAIEDQNAGGAIMMVEQSLAFVIALVVLFVAMLRDSEAEELAARAAGGRGGRRLLERRRAGASARRCPCRRGSRRSASRRRHLGAREDDRVSQ